MKRNEKNEHKIEHKIKKKKTTDLDLSLSLPSIISSLNPIPPPMPQQQQKQHVTGSTSRRGRRSSTTTTTTNTRSKPGGRGVAKSETVTPPFEWATNRRAKVHSIEYLRTKGIDTISGQVQCKKCEKTFSVEYNVTEKFQEIVTFILQQGDMSHRAPKRWTEPILPTCNHCGEVNNCKPVIAEKKRSINWLFLLLGQMLGCCTLEQLKYFCKHTNNHRTGAKDRVLFLSYFTLLKQLDPNGPFNF